MLRQRSVIGITASYAAYGYFQYLFFYWISYYFETVQHQHPDTARGYTTTITLAMGAGMLCGGWLTSRVPAFFSPWARRAIVPMVGMLASGAVFELGLLAANPKATIASVHSICRTSGPVRGRILDHGRRAGWPIRRLGRRVDEHGR